MIWFLVGLAIGAACGGYVGWWWKGKKIKIEG